MQDKKINTYNKLCKLTQEQWDNYVQEQHSMDESTSITTEDFPRIVIFQNWCSLNSHYDDNNLAFKFSREDYAKSWDEQFQLNASPTDPDLPSKSISNVADLPLKDAIISVLKVDWVLIVVDSLDTSEFALKGQTP